MIKYRGIIRLLDGTIRQTFAATRGLIIDWARTELERLPKLTQCSVIEVQETEVCRVNLTEDKLTLVLVPIEKDGRLL